MESIGITKIMANQFQICFNSTCLYVHQTSSSWCRSQLLFLKWNSRETRESRLFVIKIQINLAIVRTPDSIFYVSKSQSGNPIYLIFNRMKNATISDSPFATLQHHCDQGFTTLYALLKHCFKLFISGRQVFPPSSYHL